MILFFQLLFSPVAVPSLEAASQVVQNENVLLSNTKETITYWKPFEILPGEEPKVAETHTIFNRLLLGWEETRVAPALHVVRSDQGPWAASLDDGTILLSREAIDVCFRDAQDGGDDRLAFVLAHELAHQRADHLWHRRFFRLAGEQPPQVQGRMLGTMTMDKMEVEGLEAKETQADREGLLLMAMVGFDPSRVIGDESRFFLDWVESIWGTPCTENAGKDDCNKAKDRLSRVKAHWEDTVHQSFLFDLGIHAYVAGKYNLARQYFSAYGRQFPNREIHNNIGLTYMAEALSLRKQLAQQGEYIHPEFIYPVVLEEEIEIYKAQPRSRGGETRGRGKPDLQELKKAMEADLHEAALSFERAVKMDPSHRPSYGNLASAYLLEGNAPLAYGIIAGNYVKRFGEDEMASLFLAISAYIGGQTDKARLLFDRAILRESATPLARINRAIYLGLIGDKAGEMAEWKVVAEIGKKSGDEALFQMALRKMGKEVALAKSPPPGPEKISGYTSGERIAVPLMNQSGAVWVGGEQIFISRWKEGKMAVHANRTILALWQEKGEVATAAGVRIGDDAAKLGRIYGIPQRKISTIHGEYRAYDQSHIAFRIEKNKVAGWALY